MNVDAVLHRYDGNQDMIGQYTYQQVDDNPYQVLKSMRCLQYQCTEGDIVESELYQWLDKALCQLALELACKDKRYEEAHWG